MHRPRDQLLAHAAFAANQHRRPARRGPRDFALHLVHRVAGADDLALHAQPLAKLEILVANLIQILGQLLLPAQILERHGHGVGHGEREFQVVRIGRFAPHRVEYR